GAKEPSASPAGGALASSLSFVAPGSITAGPPQGHLLVASSHGFRSTSRKQASDPRGPPFLGCPGPGIAGKAGPAAPEPSGRRRERRSSAPGPGHAEAGLRERRLRKELDSMGRPQLRRRREEAASAEHALLSREDRPRLFSVFRPRRIRRHRVVA